MNREHGILRRDRTGTFAAAAAVAIFAVACGDQATCDLTATCPNRAIAEGRTTSDAAGGKTDGAIDGAARDGQAVTSNEVGDGAAGDTDVPDAGTADASVGDATTGDDASDAPPPCNVTAPPSQQACVIDGRYGVFVSSTAAAGGDGSKATPFNTIAKALVESQGKSIYICAGTYAETMSISASNDGAKIYGGFDCTSWAYDAAKRAVVKPTSGVPLTIKGLATGAVIQDLEFDAPGTSAKGESSIAAFVSSAKAALTRVKLVASAAQAGADGVAASNYDVTMISSNVQIAGHLDYSGVGAPEQLCTNLCINNVHGSGGKGGFGNEGGWGNGDDGLPKIWPPFPETATGAGGTSGSIGANGSNAPVAPGGVGAARAGFLGATGWTVSEGVAGTAGTPGQGGGGGSGQQAAYAGGGGGGCGGCGGAAGGAGKSGGSSFALLSYQSNLALDACDLVSEKGGDGGKGATGQLGQVGGDGGYSSTTGLDGGRGGRGAQGGGGGGGAGGHSVAIAYVGAMPTATQTMSLTAQANALGGAPGGGGSPAATKGKDGVSQAVLDLSL